VVEDPGSKADDAKRLGVRMLDEAAFLKLVGKHPLPPHPPLSPGGGED